MTVRTLLVLISVIGLLATASTASAAPSLPRSIAGIGDSMTRAADVCCWYGDHPAQSWTTGGGAFDGIKSHYERILALKPSMYGHNYNDARSGAKMADGPGQAQTAVGQGARYVTILMGANDVCTDTRSKMTSVSDFRAQFESTMNMLASGLPSGKHVFVSSIPNIYHLWDLLKGNSTAQFVWSAANICQSMLSPTNTEDDRQAVLAREEAFNTILHDVCGQYTFCRFDNYAVFNYVFSASDVSKLDYFHPSLGGQAKLASVTWEQSWWATV
jgi:lysophospholipase L1-like esterase